VSINHRVHNGGGSCNIRGYRGKQQTKADDLGSVSLGAIYDGVVPEGQICTFVYLGKKQEKKHVRRVTGDVCGKQRVIAPIASWKKVQGGAGNAL